MDTRYKKGHISWNKGKSIFKEKREGRRESDKRWRLNNSDKNRESHRKSVAKCKEKWMLFLRELGLLMCHRCGYNKCFNAIEFHHKDPSKKEVLVSTFWRRKITPERVLELKKTIPLCSNCHRELHDGIWRLAE